MKTGVVLVSWLSLSPSAPSTAGGGGVSGDRGGCR